MKEVVTTQELLDRYEINPWEKVAIVCSDGIIYINTENMRYYDNEKFDQIINFKTHSRAEIMGGFVK